MNHGRKRKASKRGLPLYIRFYLSAIVILIVGLFSAVLAYVLAQDSQAYQIASGKQYTFQVERIGGQFTVWVVHFNQWFGSLWHGRSLAYTLAFISIGAALICFLIARSLSFNMSFKSTKGRDD
ncbi:MAG: hypothetical protein ABI155_10000 [Paralcaligenes sp.]